MLVNRKGLCGFLAAISYCACAAPSFLIERVFTKNNPLQCSKFYYYFQLEHNFYHLCKSNTQILLYIFFILSSILSKIIPGNTSTISKGSKRDIIQVYANGGIALLLCIYSQFYENTTSIYLLFLSSIAAASPNAAPK